MSDVATLPQRLLNQVKAFQYATVPNAPTYRAVMQVCYESLQRYVIELRPAEILRMLEDSPYVCDVADVEELDTQVLSQLVSWGNLASTGDPAGVERLQDYYRRRLVYHVTDVGEAAHRAVCEVEATVGRSGSLQTNMLVKIRDGLHALAAAAGDGDAEQLVRLLHDVHSAFDTLTHEANRFMTDLGRLVGGDRKEASDAAFVAYKQAVLAYISRFVEQLRLLADDIAAGLAAVDAVGVDALIGSASTSADLPDFDGDGAPRERWVADEHGRWEGIVAWFVRDSRGEEPTVERLASFAVGAVLTLTRTLGRLNDRRGRPVDRTTDFLTLARWFTDCPTDEDAHELWQMAFGLHSARHLHLAEADPDLTSTRASWWNADPVEVPTRLRSHGKVTRSGRTPRAADYRDERRWLAARSRREREQLDAATARFAGSAMHLSALTRVDSGEFDLLLALLDTALTTPRNPEGVRATRSIDGRLHVALHPPMDGATCWLDTPGGRLHTPDYRIVVTDLAGATAARRAGGAAQLGVAGGTGGVAGAGEAAG